MTLSFFAVFAAGLVAALNPCSLAIIPMVFGFVGGYSGGDARKSLLFSLFFSLGLAVTFTLLGILAALTGSLLGDIGGFWKYILAAVAIVMGLQLLGVINIQLPLPKMVNLGQKGLLGAFLLGLLFGIASSPCSTPVLAVVLTYVASQQNILYGALLLFVYALANAVLVFVVGASAGMTQVLLKSSFSEYLRKVFGAILIVGGVWLAVGR